jgi:hypothetical protein
MPNNNVTFPLRVIFRIDLVPFMLLEEQFIFTVLLKIQAHAIENKIYLIVVT